jgi:predicted transposase YdaD
MSPTTNPATERAQVAREARDILLKYMARGLRTGLLKALRLSLADIEEVLPAEVPLLEVHAEYPDLLFRLKDGRILHLEFQTDRVPDLQRFWLYHIAVALFYKTTVYTVVVYGRGIRRAPDSLDCGYYAFKVHNIYLSKQDGEKVLMDLRARLERGEELDEAARIELMLLPLMAVKRPLVEVIEDVARLAEQLPKAQRDEVIGTVIGLAYATIKESEATRLLEVLRMANAIEDFVTDLLLRGREEGRAEGRTEGREEGRAEGRIEGREEGRAEGMEEGRLEQQRVAVLDVLAVRFGPVPASIAERLDQVTDLARLRSLTSLAATVATVDDYVRQTESLTR